MKTETGMKSVKDNLKQEERKKNTITKGINSDRKALEDKANTAANLKEMYDSLREENERATEALKEAQSRYEAISVGKFSAGEGGKSATLAQQMIAAREAVTQAETSTKTCEMQLKHNAKELKRMEGELKKTESERKRDTANLQKYEDQVASAEQELASINYEEGLAERLEENFQGLQHEVRGMERELDSKSSRYPFLNFRYDDPEKNFDRSQVYGPVAKLFKVKDAKFFSALDVAGGGRVSVTILTNSNFDTCLE